MSYDQDAKAEFSPQKTASEQVSAHFYKGLFDRSLKGANGPDCRMAATMMECLITSIIENCMEVPEEDRNEQRLTNQLDKTSFAFSIGFQHVFDRFNKTDKIFHSLIDNFVGGNEKMIRLMYAGWLHKVSKEAGVKFMSSEDYSIEELNDEISRITDVIFDPSRKANPQLSADAMRMVARSVFSIDHINDKEELDPSGGLMQMLGIAGKMSSKYQKRLDRRAKDFVEEIEFLLQEQGDEANKGEMISMAMESIQSNINRMMNDQQD